MALTPKAFDTLLVLVEEAGRLVTKDELLQRVWPDAFVEEGSIANNVSMLCKILNPHFDGDGRGNGADTSGLWHVRAPGTEKCSTRAQLLCLLYYLGDEELAEHVSYARAGLTRACHQHPYDLPPTSAELSAWLQTVEQFIAQVHAIKSSKHFDLT